MRRDYVLLALFMMLPYAFIHGGIIHIGHLFFLVLSALVIISLMQKNIWFSLFFIYIAVWQLFLFMKGLPGSIPSERMQMAKGYSQITFLVVGFSIYLGVLKSRIRNETFYNLICISAIAQSILAVCQTWNYDPVIYILSHFVEIKRQLDLTVACGTLGNPNFLVAYLAICLPFFFRRPWFCFIPVIAAILFISRTSAAVVPAVLAVPIYYWNMKLPTLHVNVYGYTSSVRSKWLIFFCGCVAAMGYAVYDGNIFVYTEINQRYRLWWEVLQQFESIKNWVFGFGPGAAWGYKFPMHNEWLSFLHSYGIIGLALLGGFIKTINKSNRILFTAFCVACINMIGNYPLKLAPSVFLIIIILGLMQRKLDGR